MNTIARSMLNISHINCHHRPLHPNPSAIATVPPRCEGPLRALPGANHAANFSPRAFRLAVALLCWLFASPAFAVVLCWDSSPDTNVSGYAVYWGTNSGSYMVRIDAGAKTNVTIAIATNGQTFYFVATAYTAEGVESLPSNEVSYSPPGALLASLTPDGSNQLLRFSVGADQFWQLQVSVDSTNWTTLCQLNATTNGWIDVFNPVTAGLALPVYRLVGGPALRSEGDPGPPGLVAPNDLLLSRSPDSALIQLRFGVGANRTWRLQGTDDLLFWSTLCQLTPLADAQLDFLDPLSASKPSRFYRLIGTAASP